jgi:hypothetical protein
VYPRYHAVGDDGDSPTLKSENVSVNIGCGLCMLPSEPRLRRGDEMPYPGAREEVFSDIISPKSGLRGGLIGGLIGGEFKLVKDWDA